MASLVPFWVTFITVQGAFEMVYPISGYVLFICFGYFSILMLETLTDHISHDKKGIEWCKRCYLLIGQWIDQLNQCFGFILLILITGGFIRMISTSFFLVSNFKRSNDFSMDSFIQIWVLVHEFGAVFATAYISRKIQLEVALAKLIYFKNI